MDGLVEISDVGEGLMSEVMRLQVTPDAFYVIQLRRVSEQPFDCKPMRASGEGCAANWMLPVCLP